MKRKVKGEFVDQLHLRYQVHHHPHQGRRASAAEGVPAPAGQRQAEGREGVLEVEWGDGGDHLHYHHQLKNRRLSMSPLVVVTRMTAALEVMIAAAPVGDDGAELLDDHYHR